jgi:MFS transporter, DHA2 family, methylenomycin A resistance protein
MERERSNVALTLTLTLGLCAGYFLVLLDVTVVNVALPSIGAGLHAAGPGLAWVVDAYSIPLAALLLASGAIGDRLGHRRVVVAGFLGFGAASVLCALAPGTTVLITGRALQGVCAALMLPGPFLGGLLAEAGGWRAVFWLNVPVNVAALVPVARQAPGVRDDQRLGGGVDWAGAAALAAMLGSAVTAVIQATASPRLSIAMAAVTVLAAASAVAGLMNLCSLGSLFLLTQVFQDAHRLSPLAAGLLLLPAMLPLPLLGTTAGRLTGRFGPWRTSALGLAVAAAGMAGVAASIGRSGYPALIGSLAAWGAGLGILGPAIVTAALQATPGAPGTASGASNTARQAGGALGVAAFAALAGSASDAAFVPHTSWLMTGGAVAFAMAAACCLIFRRGLRRAARDNTPPGVPRPVSRQHA